MTISNPSNIVTYNGDGATQNFPVFFYWISDAHLHVTLITLATGLRTLLSEGPDYTATGAGNLLGGNVQTTLIYSNAYQIEIKRTVPIVQSDNYVAGSILPAETVEKDFDYGIMVDQQLDQRLSSIEATGAGGAISIVNLPGSGVGVYANQVGNLYNFKKLVAGGDLTITDAGTELRLVVAGVTGALLIVNNLTDVADRQASLNNLTNVAAGGNEWVLTKDTATGNAVWKLSAGGGSGGLTYPGTTHQFLRGDSAWAYEIKDSFGLGPYSNGAALVISDTSYAPGIWINQKAANANARLFRIGSGNSGGNAQLTIATFDDTGTSGFHFPFVLNRSGNTPTTLSLMSDSGRLLVGPSSDDTATLLQIGGSMRVDGVGRVMSADTQNATLNNRFVFQDSQVNAITSLNLVPNGIAQVSNVKAHNAFPIANAAFISQSISGTVALLNSGHNGIGVTCPLSLNIDGTPCLQLTAPAGRLLLGTVASGLPTDDTTSALQLNGDLNFFGNARRIKGDMSNATFVNRLAFQSNVLNGVTSLGLLPNGTATTTNVRVFNNSDLTAPASYVNFQVTNLQANIDSNVINGGTLLPLLLTMAGTPKLRVTPAGLVTINEPTDDGTSALQVNGDLHIVGAARKIKGNFSDAVAANRLAFQTDLANSFTSMNVLPSGTGTQTFIQCFNNSDLTQPLAYGDIRISTAAMSFTTSTQNGGTQLPMTFVVAGTRMRITIAGLVTIGEPTDDGVSILQCNGTAKAKAFTLVAEVDDGSVTGAATINFVAGQYHKATMTGACTFTLTPPTGAAVVQLKLTQDATGSRVMTLPAGKWPGNYAAADKLLSTAANAVDLLTAKWDGSAWFYTLTKAWA